MHSPANTHYTVSGARTMLGARDEKLKGDHHCPQGVTTKQKRKTSEDWLACLRLIEGMRILPDDAAPELGSEVQVRVR